LIINYKKSILLFFKSNNSFLKKNKIANNDQKCKLTSINNELDLNSYNEDITIKCADELMGKNSEIPCIRDKITISIIFETIFFRSLNKV